MLAPDNRAILRDLLKPPVGSQLVRAVGTSFTLDLTAALAVPLCFASRDLGATPDPIGLMEAVRSAADRIDVFYQAGQASVPAQASDVMAFLEPVLHAVKAPRPGFLFHPKVWALKFATADGDVSYRLICSSRNLTQDRSWDAVVSIDGSPGRRREPSNQPVRQLLRSLPDMCTQPPDRQRAQAVTAFADELHKAVWEMPDDTKELGFYVLGMPRAGTPDFSGSRHLVVSPFVDPGGLRHVAPPPTRGAVLVSRPQDIDRMEAIPDAVELRVFSVLAELEEERAAGDLSGLHAKLVLVERGHNAHLFLGSANATQAAHNGNVEFVVEVVRGKSKYGVEAHLDAERGFGALLEEYTPQPFVVDPQEDLRFQLQNLLRSLAVLPWTVTTTRPESDGHNLAVTSGATLPATSARITLELATMRGQAVTLSASTPAEAAFTGVALADITPFLLLTVQQDGVRESSVIPAHLVNDPDDRLDAVLARQVDTPEKFLRFLLLVLGLSDSSGLAVAASSGGGGTGWTGGKGPALFELLARALADSPSALEDLSTIVERLSRTEAGRAVMPTGFLDLWETVQQAKQLVGART